MASPFPTGTLRFLPNTVPHLLAQMGSSSRELRASSEFCRLLSAPESPDPEHLPWGCHSSSRHQPGASMRRGSHVPPPFRPRRFSRPRRFAPLPALWVYFTPQPRPGFALQGLFLAHSRCTSSMPLCPLVVGEALLPAVAHRRHITPPRPQGFAPCESPIANPIAVNHRARSLPSWASLLQVFPLNIVETPSRPLPPVIFVRRPSSRSPR